MQQEHSRFECCHNSFAVVFRCVLALNKIPLLFAQQYQPRIAAGHEQGIDGWFG
jgi:hypothetical protein